MPPFGFDNGRLGLLQSSLSSSTEEMDCRRGDHHHHHDGGILGSREVLKNIWQRFEDESLPMELACALQALFQKAAQFSERIRDTTSPRQQHVVMGTAVDSSIRIELTEVLDQLALLLEVEEGDKRCVIAALTVASIKQASHYFLTLESMILEADTKKLEPFLNEFSEHMRKGGQEQDDPPIRVSLMSRALAFEFMAGKMDVSTLSSSYEEGSASLGLKVKAAPYLVVKSGVISSDDRTKSRRIVHKYSNCRVKIDYCSHRKLFSSSSGSGVMGEAMVRVYVNPGEQVKIPKEGTVWPGQSGGGCDDQLNIVQVRAVQTNAYPRNVQTSLDLYVSSVHGLSGFIVTVKMKTYKSFNNDIPDFDIQLIMEPPML